MNVNARCARREELKIVLRGAASVNDERRRGRLSLGDEKEVDERMADSKLEVIYLLNELKD